MPWPARIPAAAITGYRAQVFFYLVPVKRPWLGVHPRRAAQLKKRPLAKYLG